MIYQFSVPEKMLLKAGVLPQPLFDADVYYGLSRALMATVKTGLIDVVSDTFQSGKMLAQKAALHEEAVILVLDCLHAMGYINKKEETYAFTKNGKKFLTPGKKGSAYYYILFCAAVHDRSFGNLEKRLQAGAEAYNNLSDFSEEDWRLFTLGMVDLARINMDQLTKAIDIPQQGKLLDLGGSHGLYSIGQCRKSPGIKATIIDHEAVRQYAERFITANNMKEQIAFRAGDFMELEWEKGYDLIYAFNIIHGFTKEANLRLFKKAAAALKPKGKFCIFDQIKGLKTTSQLSGAVASFMGLNLYLNNGGRTFHKAELTEMLLQSGFSKVNIKSLRIPGCALIFAEN